MTRKKKSPAGLFDIPVQIPCPNCGNDVEVSLGRFQSGALDFICRPCARQFQLTDEKRSEIFIEHGKKLDALRRLLGGT